jgi:hypothetical protein
MRTNSQYTPAVEILEPTIKTPDTIRPCDESFEMTHKLPNKYAPVLSVSNDRLQLTIPKDITFCPDNKLLIIQMRGAEVQSTPSDTYGKVSSYGDAGNYEFCRISSISGNVLTLSKPLARLYNPAGKYRSFAYPNFGIIPSRIRSSALHGTIPSSASSLSPSPIPFTYRHRLSPMAPASPAVASSMQRPPTAPILMFISEPKIPPATHVKVRELPTSFRQNTAQDAAQSLSPAAAAITIMQAAAAVPMADAVAKAAMDGMK